MTSLKRISQFLLEDELASDAVEKTNRGDAAITIENGDFAWKENEDNTLKK